LTRIGSTGRELRQWTLTGRVRLHGLNGGVADSLDEAKAAFRGMQRCHHFPG